MRSSVYDFIAERNVFALINPKSGERAAAEFVRSQLEDHLAARRKRQLFGAAGNQQQQGIEREVSAGREESPPREEKYLYNCYRPCSVVHALDFSRQTWRQEAVEFLARNIRTTAEQKNSSEDCERERNETATPPSVLAAQGLSIEHHRRTSSYNVLGQQVVVSPPTSLEAAAKTTSPPPPPTDRIVENILIVAGGDGTVALAADLLNETGVLDLDLVEIAETQPTSSCSATHHHEVRNPIPTKIVSYYHDKFSVHIAVIPMGTGNDLSRSLGFGPGFVRSQGCCEGDMSTMGPLIEETISGKAIDFDLWTVHVKPSLPGEAIDGGISGKGLRAPPVSSSPRQKLATAVRVKNEPYEIRTPPSEASERQRSPQRQEEHEDERSTISHDEILGLQQEDNNADDREPKPATFTACISSSPSHLLYSPTIPACSNIVTSQTPEISVPRTDPVENNGCEPEIKGKAPCLNAKKIESPARATMGALSSGNIVDGEQSPQPRQQPQQQHMVPLKFNFVNYFSIGFDARICTEFHHLRQNHPSLCSSRFLNKAWYGILGLKALVGEPIIDAQYIKLFVDGRRIPIPPDIKSVVISNVVSFAGGVKLWSKPSATKEYRDAEGKLVGGGECVTSAHWPENEFSQSKGGGAACSPKDRTQQTFFGESMPTGTCNKNQRIIMSNNDGVSSRHQSKSQNYVNSDNNKLNAPLVGKYKEANVGDGLLEVQGLYGSIHMSMLQMKARHSIKIAQGRRIEITIMYPELLELYHSRRKKNAKSSGREEGVGVEMEVQSTVNKNDDNSNQGAAERKGDADGTLQGQTNRQQEATLTRSCIVIPTPPSASGRAQRSGHFKDLSTASASTPSVSPSMPRGTSQDPSTPLSLQKMPLIPSPSTPPPALKTKEKNSSRNRSGLSSTPNPSAPTDAHLYSPDEALRPADLIGGAGMGRENTCGQHDGDVCTSTHVVGSGSAAVPPTRFLNESSIGAAEGEGEEAADEYSPHTSATSGPTNHDGDNHNNDSHDNTNACFEPPIQSTRTSSTNHHHPNTDPQPCLFASSSSVTSRANKPAKEPRQKNSKNNEFTSDSLSTGGSTITVKITPQELNSLPPSLATQLDGEAMPKIEQMLQEYGAVTFLITRRQTASMLNIASPSGEEGDSEEGNDGQPQKKEQAKDNSRGKPSSESERFRT